MIKSGRATRGNMHRVRPGMPELVRMLPKCLRWQMAVLTVVRMFLAISGFSFSFSTSTYNTIPTLLCLSWNSHVHKQGPSQNMPAAAVFHHINNHIPHWPDQPDPS